MIGIALRGRARALESSRQHDKWIAWHIMAPHVQKMPELREFMGLEPEPRREMSWEEMYRNMEKWRIVMAATEKAKRRGGPQKKPKIEQA